MRSRILFVVLAVLMATQVDAQTATVRVTHGNMVINDEAHSHYGGGNYLRANCEPVVLKEAANWPYTYGFIHVRIYGMDGSVIYGARDSCAFDRHGGVWPVMFEIPKHIAIVTERFDIWIEPIFGWYVRYSFEYRPDWQLVDMKGQ